jgi:hypothetical protein
MSIARNQMARLPSRGAWLIVTPLGSRVGLRLSGEADLAA